MCNDTAKRTDYKLRSHRTRDHLVIVHLELEQVPEEELDVLSVRVDNDVVDLLTLDLPQHLPKLSILIKELISICFASI